MARAVMLVMRVKMMIKDDGDHHNQDGDSAVTVGCGDVDDGIGDDKEDDGDDDVRLRVMMTITGCS